MALLGTSLMQALKLLLAATVGLWPSTQHPTPFQVSVTLHSALVHPAELAGPRGYPRPSSSVESHVHTLFLTSW